MDLGDDQRIQFLSLQILKYKQGSSMYPRSYNKSTIHLVKDQPLTPLQQEHSNLSKDIYYQHIKNKQLYDHIKQINPYFQYILKNRAKNDNNDIATSIREHNSLLQQYAYLINCQQKYEFQAESMSKQCEYNLSFFKDIWNKKENNQVDMSNQERIDRLNKNIAFIKTNVNQLMKKESRRDDDLHYQELIYSTKEYQQLSELYKANRLELEQIKHKLEPQSRKDHVQDVSQEYNRLKEQFKKLQETNSKLTSLNKTMLSKISKLTQEIMQKDKQLNQLKTATGVLKKYQSQGLTTNNKPLFQITIKQNRQDVMNNSQYNRHLNTRIVNTKKPLDTIINFIEDAFEQKLGDPFNFININDHNLSIISMSDKSQMQKGKDLQDLMDEISDKQNERMSFSDKKIARQPKKRQLIFNPKLALGANEDVLNMSKQLRFVRRK